GDGIARGRLACTGTVSICRKRGEWMKEGTCVDGCGIECLPQLFFSNIVSGIDDRCDHPECVMVTFRLCIERHPVDAAQLFAVPGKDRAFSVDQFGNALELCKT